MADMSKIRDDILPELITIDNIGEWNGYTSSAVNTIIRDLSKDLVQINKVIDKYNNLIDQYHYIGKILDRNKIRAMKKGSVFFIRKGES